MIYIAATDIRTALPLLSSVVPAGFPSPAEDFVEGRLDLNEHLIHHPAATFIVRVEGESMIGAGVHPGDLLVVDRSLEPRHGDVVIAVLNGELTVKRLEKRAGRCFLSPANPVFPPIEIGDGMDCVIWGVVSSAIHQFNRR
ncbi:MAG: translesion error-prone DNA polymerase V autoproteolytic subunit [Rhodospirillales bacterium]|nr:translesion error-prone DNA polymerase V autoproteolytic subunit [Rhodospirillales bacterium]